MVMLEQNVWDEVASGWEAWWHVMEKDGKKVSRRLVELAHIQEGNRVLDLATGGGEPALEAVIESARQHARPNGTLFLQNETICYSAQA